MRSKIYETKRTFLKFKYKQAYLGGDAADEAFDVQLSRARLLTRGVGAFETTIGFTQGSPFAKCRVFDVVKVLEQIRRSARLNI